jgi:quercetin dioxygenase-like cupin family protein
MSSNRVRSWRFLLPFALLACAPGPSETGLPLPAGASFVQNPNLLPGGEIAVVAGTPSGAGPYATRVRLPAGFRVMPHSHPDDRLYTVLSGTLIIGLGAEMDSTKLLRLPPGQVYLLQAGVVHYHWMVDGASTFQVSGVGPTATTYLRPEDDPRHQ